MGTIIVGAVVLCIAAAAAYKLYSDRKKGKGCGGCKGCPSANGCGAHFENEETEMGRR